MDFCGRWIQPRLAYIDNAFHENVALKISESGLIEEIVTQKAALPSDARVVQLHNEALLPGFVNAHSHAFHRQLRGRSGIGGKDAENFWLWRDNMYKLVADADYDHIYQYCVATFTEMLHAGVTTVGEFHYVHHDLERFDLDDAVIRAAEVTGIRLVLIETLYCRAGFSETSVSQQQQRFESHVDEFVQHMKRLKASKLPANVKLAVAAHSLRAVPIGQLKRLYDFALSADLPFHLHLEEQPKEVTDCETVECCTPSELLLTTLPTIDQRVTAVHCTHTKRKHLNTFADKGVNVCICPLTEGFLGDGVPNLHACDRLCLGTDCNSRLCFLEEMRWLAYSQNTKTNSRNTADLDAAKLLRIATQNGALSLGIANQTGSIAKNLCADFTCVDLGAKALSGVDASELLDALVFGCGNTEIKRTVVQGLER